MKTNKVRITTQRELILQELRSEKNHPTADELYERIKRLLPRISLATVYRNLEWLNQQGLIKKIEIGGKQKRFDAVTDEHYHIRCISCGRIDDVMLNTDANIKDSFCEIDGYHIVDHCLELFGLCLKCKNSNKYFKF